MEARVYRNLVNGLWSIKQRIDGKWVVVGHCESCVLNNVSPYVSGARHDHVRSGNHREVFAWLMGDLVLVKDFVPYKGREAVTIDGFPLQALNRTSRVTFHPFADIKRGFYWVEDGEEYRGSSCAYFLQSREVWAR